jgi:ribosome-associated heat shock protein Hsp15
VSGQRGSAPIAQQLYAETADSIAAQAAAREQRRLGSEPALSIEQGRPTKRERRNLDQATRSWGPRWSASVDDPDGGE